MELPRIQGVSEESSLSSRPRSKSSSPEVHLLNPKLNFSLKRFRRAVRAVKADLTLRGLSAEQIDSKLMHKMVPTSHTDIKLDSNATIHNYFQARADGLDRQDAMRALYLLREVEKVHPLVKNVESDDTPKNGIGSSSGQQERSHTRSEESETGHRCQLTSSTDQSGPVDMEEKKNQQSNPDEEAPTNAIDFMTQRIEKILDGSTNASAFSSKVDLSSSPMDGNPFSTLPGISNDLFLQNSLPNVSNGLGLSAAAYRKRFFSNYEGHEIDEGDEELPIPRPLKRFADGSYGAGFPLGEGISMPTRMCFPDPQNEPSDFDRSCLSRVKRKAEEEDYRAEFEGQEGVRDSKKRLKY